MSSDDSLAKSESQAITDSVDRSPLALLSAAIKKSCNEADDIITDVIKAMERQTPDIAQLTKATEKGFRLVVDASDDTLQAIDRGDIKLTTDKLGNTFAQLMENSAKSSLLRKKSSPKESIPCRQQTQYR